ncbi:MULTISPECIES: TIGR03557 family F420-dependent LLM class oxidoreductase [Nocardioides]|uniref:TIGR03557 family F420-dependent LLM class oxidoreductase n=1 Tax=Nocardioides vastitatis TaxID=2568655 RepID=A0ABW0ZDP6_9ACTN|nr:TIGR03557 family F420-dependent LLM class oxidoreductase [Nocardioides sp.]THJ01707.1 TIGR03557 family F420-dependent LLM class oxidoreductase [Nocardioides sp.]
MATFGYFLSTEEHTPQDLVEQARLAEDAGFDALWISDHFHPWNDEQGHSPFVWSLIGAISQVTSLPVTTAVTCPIMRLGPVITAQAAATSAVMLGGRFRLGVGTGEALNEHVLGDPWPSAPRRLEMLEESVALMRELWSGEVVEHHGTYYTAENAQIYTRPDQPPEVWMSAFGTKAAEVAARISDGLVTTTVDEEVLTAFRDGGGTRTSVGFKVCWADSEDEGVAIAHRLWANAGLPGELAQILPTPRHFEQASQLVPEESTRDSVTCGSDTGRHLAAYDEYLKAGFDEIYVGNMGHNYRPMLEAYGETVLPALRAAS